MSASDPNSAIYVTDTAKDIKSKVCVEAYDAFHIIYMKKLLMCLFSFASVRTD